VTSYIQYQQMTDSIASFAFVQGQGPGNLMVFDSMEGPYPRYLEVTTGPDIVMVETTLDTYARGGATTKTSGVDCRSWCRVPARRHGRPRFRGRV